MSKIAGAEEGYILGEGAAMANSKAKSTEKRKKSMEKKDSGRQEDEGFECKRTNKGNKGTWRRMKVFMSGDFPLKMVSFLRKSTFGQQEENGQKW